MFVLIFKHRSIYNEKFVLWKYYAESENKANTFEAILQKYFQLSLNFPQTFRFHFQTSETLLRLLLVLKLYIFKQSDQNKSL